MNTEWLARLLVLVGVTLAGAGAFLWIVARLPFYGALGNLPGDIVFRRGPLTVVVPLTTMVLLSLVLTVVGNLVIRFLRR